MLETFLRDQAPCFVAMEACATSHFWAQCSDVRGLVPSQIATRADTGAPQSCSYPEDLGKLAFNRHDGAPIITAIRLYYAWAAGRSVFWEVGLSFE